MFENIDKKRAFFAILLGTVIVIGLAMGVAVVMNGLALIRDFVMGNPISAVIFSVIWVGAILFAYSDPRLLNRPHEGEFILPQRESVAPPPVEESKPKKKRRVAQATSDI